MCQENMGWRSSSTMQAIKLNKKTWTIDTNRVLGAPGGFGEVFRGIGEDGDVAIKRLKLTASDAAHRELQIGRSLSERVLKHVVPILDCGQDADSDRYFIVMPICDMSLQDEISKRGAFSTNEVIKIVLAILQGLSEVRDITHRDLKPSNILMHESEWKIADFGIAKFVEDSTSLETLRSSLTPAYAAPEQWLLQKPTNATDIYAAGCIVHALITGRPPFVGDVDSLRHQHLSNTPPPLDELLPGARAIVSQMLRKSPDIRPKLDRCLSVFEESLRRDSTRSAQGADSKLANAVSELAIAQAQREAEHQVRLERKRQRDLIFSEAAQELARIKKHLFDEIKNHAQDVMEARSSEVRLQVGNATLMFDTSSSSHGIKGIRKSDPEEMGGDGGWGVHKKQSEWDIVGIATISIEQQIGHHGYTRCANIVFGRPGNDSDYRWYEMAFWSLSRDKRKDEPFCLEYVWDIDIALSRVKDVNNLAHDPVPIDGEDEGAFVEYWKDLIASAIVGKLERPSQMPIRR
jgi:serine/threonine protein kinase